jgi:regulation of enolase protein 1 (concanavalin A-like superfamily)
VSKIAWIEGSNWTYSAEWDKYEDAVSVDVQQESNPVSLVAGQRYSFEILHKEASGHDAVAVGWQLPSGLYERPIQARHLSPSGTPPPPPPLPAPWNHQDIGAVGIAGSATHSSGTFTVQAGGTDIWDAADAFHFVYQPLTGDGEIVADVSGLANPSGAAWSLAAVMIREKLTANSVHAAMMITTDGKAKFRRRTVEGGTTASDGPSVGTTYPPRWLKLTRTGDVFTAAISSDGVTWTQVHTPQTIPMAQTVQIGFLALRNGSTAPAATATFTQVSVHKLPAPWQEADIGTVGAAGSASLANGTFTIQGGGTDLWDAADAFHYVYQTMSGDGEIVANVEDLDVPAGSSWSLAAVMIRQDLTAGSVHDAMMITTEGKAKFRRRTTAGGTTASDGPSAGTTYPPRWLKLTRAGNVFTAAISTDGITWTQVHIPQTIAMPTDVLVGLAVLRNGGTGTATATIGDVSVVP